MRSRLLTMAAILIAALLTTTLSGGFSLLNVLGWAAYFTSLLWPWVSGRSKPQVCRPPAFFRRG